MRSAIISSSILALSGLSAFVFAAPVSDSSITARTLTCVFTGEWDVSEVIGTGPDQPPIVSTFGSVTTTIDGQVTGAAEDVDSISLKAITFQPSQIGFPVAISWSADFDVGFRACFVTVQGTDYTGGPIQPSGGSSAGESRFACAVTVDCSGIF